MSSLEGRERPVDAQESRITRSSEFDEKWVDSDWTSNTRREGETSFDLSDDGNSGVDGGSIAGDGEKLCSPVQQCDEFWLSN